MSKDQTLPEVTIYTDGACSGNPGPGGWGALLIFGKIEKEISGYHLETTNNKMELQAAIEALKLLKKSCSIDLYTDSKYVQQGITVWIKKWITSGWKSSTGKPVKNIEFWQELYAEFNKHQVRLHWVKGHGTNPGNIKADAIAVKAKEEAIIKLKTKEHNKHELY